MINITNHPDANLDDWDDMPDQDWTNLLLGNGFSMNIWERFGYPDLFKLAKSSKVGNPLEDQSIALFEHLSISNFEDVLRILYHAKIVDDQLESPQKNEIECLYENTKKALASAVTYAHIPPNRIDASAINNELRKYINVFTTNYDLIPYWSIMDKLDGFKDYFWDDGTCFDTSNTRTNASDTNIHYLHGAIHLVELSNGKTKKLTANGLAQLSELFDLDRPEQFPLFLAEGTSEWKLARINRNDYLRFCYEKLGKINGGLVVLGHSLHKDFDQHIIHTVNTSDASGIAIGVWPHQNDEDIVSFKKRLAQDLPNKEPYFFNSETHPLGASSLNVPLK